MNKLLLRFFKFFLMACLFLLSACGLGFDAVEFPVERPVSIVSGSGSGGFLKKSDINIYQLTDAGRIGEHLGSAKINDQGTFAFELSAQSQFIFIQASSGIYLEPISNREVSLPEGYVLSSIAAYQTGESLHIELTPFTHLATSLMRYYLVQGISIDDAYQQASDFFREWLGFDVFRDSTQVIVAGEQDSLVSSGNLKYRLYLSALSGLSAWIAQKNGHENSETYNTLSVLEVMNRDISADGLLDGLGLNENNEIVPLAVGSLLLNPDIYRMGLAQQLIIAATEQEEFSSVDFPAIIDLAKNLARDPTALISDKETKINLAQFSPEFKYHFAQTGGEKNSFSMVVSVVTESLIDRIFFTVDGNDIEVDGLVNINPAEYDLSEVSLLIHVVDIFGNAAQKQVFIDFNKILTRFNNTYLEITSPLITNQLAYPIEGIFNGQDITSVSVFGIEMQVDDVGNWRGLLLLTPGLNTLDIVFSYADAFEESLTAEIIVDQISPIVHTGENHSNAEFIDGGVKPLEDVNENAIVIESDKLDLDGVLIESASLEANGIPYFRFSLSDEGNIRQTSDTSYDVQYKYFIDEEQQGDAKVLLSAGEGEYLLPLVAETLHPQWYRTNRDQVHRIRLEIKDAAGNLSLKDFSFKADIRVSVPVIDYSVSAGADIFNTTDFADRHLLSNIEFASTQYSLTNNTDSNFYIRFSDVQGHLMTHVIDEMVRENFYSRESITEWRITGIIVASIYGECPQILSDVVPVTRIWKNVGLETNVWAEVLVPVAYREEFVIGFDELPENDPTTPWEDATKDFNRTHGLHIQQKLDGENNPIAELRYAYDFLKSLDHQFFPSYIKSWESFEINPLDGSIYNAAICPQTELSLFQKRNKFVNYPVNSYPKDALSLFTHSEAFNTSGFKVFNNTINADIVPEDAWFSVPIGHSVSISKMLTTPKFEVYEELGVLTDVDEYSSYITKRYDNNMSWKINSALEISTVVDAGEKNIGLMTERSQSIAGDAIVYEISRPFVE